MGTNARHLGKYELQTLLGQGGMGEVWKAFDTQLQRYVAIKLLHADLRNDPNFVSRFQREAQVIASLHHPNIVQIYDFQTSEPPESECATCYMVMDYVEGHTLSQYIANTSRIGKYPSADDLMHLFMPICMAIDYAHQKGMLHRDIKPSNILLDERSLEARLRTGSDSSLGEPILSDFGIAKLLEATTNTLSGWLGTPYYTSPEQARGASGDIRSDLYSLGVILYELCTGVRPFQGEHPAAIILQQIHATPTSPILINPQLPVELNMLILRGMAKEPAERFPCAIDMATALALALNWPVPAILGKAPYSLQTSVEQARRIVQPISVTSFPSHPSLQMANPSSSPVNYQPGPPAGYQPGPTPTPAGYQPGSTSANSSDYRSGPPSNPSGSQHNPLSMGSASGNSPARYAGINTPWHGDSHYFAIQEYIKGKSLEWQIERLNQPMEEREVLLYASQVLDALDYLSKETPPKVHGDISPATIIIGTCDGRAHLMGAGTPILERKNVRVEQRNIVGYIPLEQFQGHAEPRSDLYALAATMHHLLTNRDPRNYPPFVYPMACQINPQLSIEVELILIRALTNDISQRYQSAAEMKRDIDNILVGRYGISGDMNREAIGTVAAPPAGNTPTGNNFFLVYRHCYGYQA